MTALVKLLSLDLCLYIPEKKNYTLKYDRIYRSCRCAIRFQNFKFIPLGQMRVVNWRFLFYCKVYHLNYICIVRSRQLVFYHQLMFVGIFILSLGVIWVWNNGIQCWIGLLFTKFVVTDLWIRYNKFQIFIVPKWACKTPLE